jgi:hypothetical protein
VLTEKRAERHPVQIVEQEQGRQQLTIREGINDPETPVEEDQQAAAHANDPVIGALYIDKDQDGQPPVKSQRRHLKEENGIGKPGIDSDENQ